MLAFRPAAAQPSRSPGNNGVSLVVLGTVQDGGSPHIGCDRVCCVNAGPERRVVSLGLAIPENRQTFLFEATPDIGEQLRHLSRAAGLPATRAPDGIFLSHAHIGHYTGLMYLGKEALNADSVRVYAMPRMRDYLTGNGPWDQLVKMGNIRLEPLQDSVAVPLGPGLSIRPIRVPHRDEYSETVGFLIRGPEKTALFIPDIDKWERWDTPIESILLQVDLAFVDATFYHASEVGYRDITQILHPFVGETRDRLDGLSEEQRNKVYFIHLNHTNPLLNPESDQSRETEAAGYRIARAGDLFRL